MSKNGKSLEVLKNLLGEELFLTTLNTFAGQKILFPKNPESFDRDSRNRQIQHDFREGVSVYNLMEQYDLSESQIYKILGRVS